MNYVDPIRNPKKVQMIAEYLKEQSDRNFIMFETGIYSGLRISDILSLKVRDIKNKDHVAIKEKKTGKHKKFIINPILKKEIKCYCNDKEGAEYLIKSREGSNKPLSREMAYKILSAAGDNFGLGSIGTHSMRKTFGYHHYAKYKDVALLQKIFNHSSPAITLDYIGIDQEYIDKSMKNFKIY